LTQHRVAVIEGDGAGPEVIAEARKAVDAASLDIEWIDVPCGTEYYHVVPYRPHEIVTVKVQ
jgi:isocitrate/isopropylmalate dehydrogenase